jgi:methylated-DNA-protein-cysteine methyltransferase-like protein
VENFFERVWEVACLVPVGRVTSYGAIARYLGTGGSARMVGWAMNNSKAAKANVPAHRVVNSKGLLTGKHHFGGSNVMTDLLESEGIMVENDEIVNFEQVFWDPVKELEQAPLPRSFGAPKGENNDNE